MIPSLLLACVAAAVCLVPAVLAKDKKAFVHLKGNQRKCFLEEVTQKTVLMLETEAELINAQTNAKLPNQFSFLITVEDPHGNIITRQESKPSNRLFVTAPSTGEYVICFAVKQYIPNSICRLYLEVYLGDPGDDRITSPAEYQLHEFSYAIANNNEVAEQIAEEQKLQGARRLVFQALSYSLSRNVYWLAAAQIVVLSLTALWQMRYLKRFFQAKKLV